MAGDESDEVVKMVRLLRDAFGHEGALEDARRWDRAGLADLRSDLCLYRPSNRKVPVGMVLEDVLTSPSERDGFLQVIYFLAAPLNPPTVRDVDQVLRDLGELFSDEKQFFSPEQVQKLKMIVDPAKARSALPVDDFEDFDAGQCRAVLGWLRWASTCSELEDVAEVAIAIERWDRRARTR